MPVQKTFKNERVELDGREFVGCTFDGCILVYRGGGIPRLQGNSLARCEMEFADAAGRTVEFLRALHQGGFADFVDPTLDRIRGA